ncbi:MAG: glycosyltransferase family 4 protein [Planctomycetes bacterium]|nr:glycosyltransferase family 4 protein [Planctomycetota bacterium]
MKVLFLGRGHNHPATRYRITQFLDYFRLNRVEPVIEDFPDGFFKWWRLSKKKYDIVFIQKKRVSVFWLERFKSQGAKVLYDFDDAVMFASSRHATPDSPKRMKAFVKMVKASDGIIAGNPYLKEQAEQYNKKAWIIPTSMDTEKYPIARHGTKDPATPVILGWIGGGKSLVFLQALLPALEELAGKFNIQLKIVCNAFFDSDKIKIIKKQWKEEHEILDVLTFDIGLAPLPDDPWSKGKCAAKLLQYMAGGIPSVASPVGVHTEIIQEGVNGLLATTPEEWKAKLERLIADAKLRESCGLEARKTVEERYSVKSSAPKLINIFKEIVK